MKEYEKAGVSISRGDDFVKESNALSVQHSLKIIQILNEY